MRLLPVSLLFGIFASAVIAEASEQPLSNTNSPGESATPNEKSVDERPQPTLFNEVLVPPLPDIEGEKFNATIKQGYWFVKHHSLVALIDLYKSQT